MNSSRKLPDIPLQCTQFKTREDAGDVSRFASFNFGRRAQKLRLRLTLLNDELAAKEGRIDAL